MITLAQARSALKKSATQADASGNGVLATQEVKHSGLSKLQQKVLAQAVSVAANSTGGQSVANVKRKIDSICDEFVRRDLDRDGKISAVELGAVDDRTTRAQLKALNLFVTAPSKPSLSTLKAALARIEKFVFDAGANSIGIGEGFINIYLATDDAAIKKAINTLMRSNEPNIPFQFGVLGEFVLE